MGQKSRNKKQKQQKKQQQQQNARVTQTVGGTGPVSLASLEGAIQKQEEKKSVKVTEVAYEMIGDLRHDIRKILLLIGAMAVVILVLHFLNGQTTFLLDFGEKAASAMRLQ